MLKVIAKGLLYQKEGTTKQEMRIFIKDLVTGPSKTELSNIDFVLLNGEEVSPEDLEFSKYLDEEYLEERLYDMYSNWSIEELTEELVQTKMMHENAAVTKSFLEQDMEE